MMFIILSASVTFSEVLAFTGATERLIEIFSSFFSSPILVVLSMQLLLFIFGMFLESLPIMMITVPIFWPILNSYDINSLWFATIMLLNLEIGMITPPFGLSLFVIRGIIPEIRMAQVYSSCMPIVLLQMGVLMLILLFPSLVLWLPMSMHR